MRPPRRRRSVTDHAWLALQLHHVAFRIGDVDRRPVAFGAIYLAGLAVRGTEALEMRVHAGLVERVDAQAEVVDVTARSGRRPALAAEFAVGRDEVDEDVAGTQLYQPDVELAFDRRAEHGTVERRHAFDVPDPQDHVIEMDVLEHARPPRPRIRFSAAGSRGHNDTRPSRRPGRPCRPSPRPATAAPAPPPS